MAVYILLALVILILPRFKINKKTYCIIVGVLMTLVVGCRSINMGMGDTRYVYVSIFDQIRNMNLTETFNFIINADIEIVFYMLTRIYIFITSNVQIYLLLLSIPINYAVSRFIYKHSNMPALSFILYFSLNYFAFSFTLLRHCIALAIILWSYDYLKEGKLKQFIVTVIIAGLFHRTAWIFILAYPLRKVKFDYKIAMIAIAIALFISRVFGIQIYNAIFHDIIASSRYAMYIDPNGNTLTFFAINLLILIVSIILIKMSKKDEEMQKNNLMLNLQTVGICLASTMTFFSEMFRISTFFTIFSIVLLPNTLSILNNKKTRIIVEIGMYIVFIAYFFCFTMYNNAIYPYQFGGFIR